MAWLEEAFIPVIGVLWLGGGLLVWPLSRLFLPAHNSTRRGFRTVFWFHLVALLVTLPLWAILIYTVPDGHHFGIVPYGVGSLSLSASFLVCIFGLIDLIPKRTF